MAQAPPQSVGSCIRPPLTRRCSPAAAPISAVSSSSRHRRCDDVETLQPARRWRCTACGDDEWNTRRAQSRDTQHISALRMLACRLALPIPRIARGIERRGPQGGPRVPRAIAKNPDDARQQGRSVSTALSATPSSIRTPLSILPIPRVCADAAARPHPA
eukprot:361840-Chlamydomonas_euryale.AAC.4